MSDEPIVRQLKANRDPSGVLDFIAVLTGHAVIPADARAFASNLMRAVAIDNPTNSTSQFPPSIWLACTRAIKSAPAVLESSPVVFIYRERGPHGELGEEQTTCRQVSLHAAPFNAWGVQFKACGNGCVDVLATDFTYRADRGAIRCQCALCGWKSCRVKHEDVAGLVPMLSPDTPLIFWHTYPPSAHLLDAFLRMTKERRG